ncbi:hypothetical protein BFP72_00595 [Reichenbachiella sp. 5M10]|nr:hypothetical protein BFP72_00595 [Reichenbachiella sp. 5M10]
MSAFAQAQTGKGMTAVHREITNYTKRQEVLQSSMQPSFLEFGLFFPNSKPHFSISIWEARVIYGFSNTQIVYTMGRLN